MRNMVLLLVTTALLAVISGTPGWYRVVYLIGGLLILLWWNHRENRKIIITRNLIRSSGFAGTPLELVVCIVNPSRFPVFWLVARHDFPETLGSIRDGKLMSLTSRGHKEMKVAFSGAKRGIYPIPDTRITFGDPWGVRELELSYPCKEKIVIYPRLFPVYGLQLVRHLPLGRKRIFQGLHEDPSRLRGCREYAPGDSLKRIHWPNAARTGQLQVKEWETTLNAEICIFLNLREADYPVTDWLRWSENGIELAAAVSHLLIGQGERLGFYSNGITPENARGDWFELPPKQGSGQEQIILTYLAGVGIGEGPGFHDLKPMADKLSVGSCILLITPCIDPHLVTQAGKLRRNGLHPVFLWLGEKRTELPAADLYREKLPCFKVEKRRDSNGLFLNPENGLG